MTCASATLGIIIPGTGKGIGSAMKSPYAGFATRTKPANPRDLAVLRIAVREEVWLKKPAEKVQMTMLPSTKAGSKACGY